MKRTALCIALALATFAARADFAHDAYNYQHGDAQQRAALTAGKSAGYAADLDGAKHTQAIHQTATARPDTTEAGAQAREAAAHAARMHINAPSLPAQGVVAPSVGVSTPTQTVPATVTNIAGPVVNPTFAVDDVQQGNAGAGQAKAKGQHQNAQSTRNNNQANAASHAGMGRTNAGGVNHY